MTPKELVAKTLSEKITSGLTLGMGSGSTVELAIGFLAKRIKSEGLSLRGIPTSERTAELAANAGIDIISPLANETIDLAFDGADEVDKNLNLTKGGGGMLLSEKIIAKRAGSIIVIVTEDKLVDGLGKTFPIPVEVIPSAKKIVERELTALGAGGISLRMEGDTPYITEHGNYIFDVKYGDINPARDELLINQITGVVENGLFVGLTKEVLVARNSGEVITQVAG